MATAKAKTKSSAKKSASKKTATGKKAAKKNAPGQGGILGRWFSSFRPSKVIIELTAATVCLIILGVVVLLGWDQYRHWADPDHARAQTIKRGFFCASHEPSAEEMTRASDGESNLDATRFKVKQLLETARQRSLPTDVVGKIETFFMCATVTSASLKSLVITNELGAGRIVTARSHDELAKIEGQLEELVRTVPNYPDDIWDQQKELFNALNQVIAVTVAVEPDMIVDPETGKPIETSQSSGLWILIVGADQTDQAALHEVRNLQKLLDQNEEIDAVGKVQIYRVRSWRRTVAQFATEAEARDALRVFGPHIRDSSYVRPVDQWCEDLLEPGDDIPVPSGDPITVKTCSPGTINR